MNWQEMKALEPELARLEESAKFAGEHGASWWDFLLASHESLSKIAGRGAAIEALQSAQCYELARAGLFRSWSRGTKGQPINTAVDDGDAVQSTFVDTSEAYR